MECVYGNPVKSVLYVKNIRQVANVLLRYSIFLYQYNAKIDKISNLEQYTNHLNLISPISINILCMDVLSFGIKKIPSAVMVIFWSGVILPFYLINRQIGFFFWNIWSNQKSKDIFDAKMAYGQQHFLVRFFTPATPWQTSFSDPSLSFTWSFIREKL